MTLDWRAIALRLLLTAIAGALIGINRGEHGHPAGLRTTILVALAASVSMIQANLLMNVTGKHPDSFVVLDLMRFPLGILSGMGFIGAGAILRKGNLVRGVTTAATLWFVTVMGLCFGGGQLGLGVADAVIGLVVLSGLKHVDLCMHPERRATLLLRARNDGPGEAEIRARLDAAGIQVNSCGLLHLVNEKILELVIDVHWRAPASGARPPEILRELAGLPGVLRLEWTPER
jgi:putative Mg2+ transporter-C (MgtC) family protein